MLGALMAAPPDTLQRLLERAAAFPAAGLRLLDAAERETFLAWPEVAARAVAVAGRLAAAGVLPGERVALVYPTGAEFFSAFFGILDAGAVPVPLYPPVRLGRLAEYEERTAAMLHAAGVVLVLADARLSGLVGRAVERARPRLGGATLAALPAAPPRRVAGAPDDLALVQFSSGTTVDPKPVALTQRAVLAQTRALTALWPDTPELTHSGVSWLPLYHDMGLIGCVFPALERPGVLTLLPPESFVARPALWLRALARHRATISVAPNFAYALASERIRDEELEGCDLGAWAHALCGAETVSAATLRGFAARFARFGFRAEALRPVYGLSEAALAVTFAASRAELASLRVERAALARGEVVEQPRGSEIVSLGRPLAGFALELRDEAGGALGEDRVGRVFVAGPSLMREYLGRPEESARVLAGGWLDTGDLGFLHEGELYLTGRAKDVLILRGLNHSPAEVEAAAGEVAGARRGCAVAVSHRPAEGATDRLLLFVEHRRGLSARERGRLPRRCREAVLGATGLAVEEVIVLAPGTLPRTSSGKLRRGETLARHLDGRLDAPAPAGRLRLAWAWLAGRRAFARAAPR
jgi:fatty-acyl-CoA synthase